MEQSRGAFRAPSARARNCRDLGSCASITPKFLGRGCSKPSMAGAQAAGLPRLRRACFRSLVQRRVSVRRSNAGLPSTSAGAVGVSRRDRPAPGCGECPGPRWWRDLARTRLVRARPIRFSRSTEGPSAPPTTDPQQPAVRGSRPESSRCHHGRDALPAPVPGRRMHAPRGGRASRTCLSHLPRSRCAGCQRRKRPRARRPIDLITAHRFSQEFPMPQYTAAAGATMQFP